MASRIALPPPPVNVRVRYPDGRTFPLDTVYLGRNADGLHVWEVTRIIPGSARALALLCDQLPKRTVIRATFECDSGQRG